MRFACQSFKWNEHVRSRVRESCACVDMCCEEIQMRFFCSLSAYLVLFCLFVCLFLILKLQRTGKAYIWMYIYYLPSSITYIIM